MAALSVLSESFESGTNGQSCTTGNTIFESFTGTGSLPAFTNDAYVGSLAMSVQTAANNIIARADTSAKTTLWLSFYIKILTTPTTSVAIINWYSTATKIGDIRLNSDRTLSLRDVNTTQWTSTNLAANTWHRISIRCQPGSVSGHQLKIYSGANLDTMIASQNSGNLSATGSVSTSVDNIRLGIISNETAQLRFDALQADDATEPVISGGTSTGLSVLTENFENGSNGATITSSNTIFNSITGSGNSQFTSNPAIEGSLAMRTNVLASSSINRVDFAAQTMVWTSFYLYIASSPGTATAILNWNSGITKIGDVRLAADNTVQIRDNITARWTSSPLATGQWHRIAVKMVPSSATGHRLKVYSGVNLNQTTSSQDSGNQTATAATQSSVDNLRFGAISTDTMNVVFDRIRGDSAVEPAPLSGGGGSSVSVNAGNDQLNLNAYQTVTLQATASGGTAPYSYAWTQISGSPTVTLSGSGATRTFSAPAVLPIAGTTLTFQVTATDASSATNSDTITVSVLCHNEYTRTTSGTWSPVNIKYREGGLWQ